MCGLLSKLPRLQKWRKTKLRTFLSSLLFGAQRVCTKWNTSPLFATKTEVLSRNVHPFSNARLCIFHRATVAIVLFGGGSDLSCICGLPFVAAGRRATSRSAAASSSAAAAPTATVTRGNCTPSCNGKNTVQLNNHLLRKWCSGMCIKMENPFNFRQSDDFKKVWTHQVDCLSVGSTVQLCLWAAKNKILQINQSYFVLWPLYYEEKAQYLVLRYDFLQFSSLRTRTKPVHYFCWSKQLCLLCLRCKMTLLKKGRSGEFFLTGKAMR